jgi:outer membrane protein insertion porin family
MKRCVLPALFLCATIVVGFAQDVSSPSARGGDEWYQGKIIKNIVFSGLRHVRTSELEGLIEPYKGRQFSDSLFWEIQGKLYALEYFELITPSIERADYTGTEIIIRFTVTERPIVSRINFIGNSGVRRQELLDIISIKNNDVINNAKIAVDELAIVNKYLEEGYPDVTVRSETQPASNSTIILNFYITEGDKIFISAFRFEGNTVFSARTLTGQLSLKAKTLINKGAFQESKLIADIAAITQYYHNRGYIDAEVVDVTREIQTDEKGNNGMILTFRISEGRIYTFGGVTFEGNQIFSTAQLSALIRSRTGETINSLRVEMDLQNVLDLYYENGYIFNTISRAENRNQVEGVVSYHITIVERGRAHIENIIIIGNVKTKTEVILREIPLEPGDVFSKTKVMEAWRNLMNLRFFTQVTVETPYGSEDSLMDLVFTVEEQPTVDLQFGLTFSGSADPETFPVSGLIKWDDRNFQGTGNQLGADLNASFDTASLSVTYNQRWMFGLPFSGGFDFSAQWAKRLAAMNNNAPFFNGNELYAYPDGFASRDEYDNSSKLPPREFLMDYNQWYLSLGFSTGYRWLTPLGILSVGGGVRTGLLRNDYDDGIYRPFDPALRERHNEWTPKNSFYTTISLDQRDLYYDPSNGYYAYDRFGIYGIFGKDINGRDMEREYYMRNDLRAEYYITLFNLPITEKWNLKSVLAIHSGLSVIFKQPGRDKDSLTPRIEEANKLSVDGMFIGRGWNSEYHDKGLLLWENWVELRFPIVPGLLAWDFFFDAAGVEASQQGVNRKGIQGYYFGKNNEGRQNFTIDNMRFSFGGGFRFTMPQFPLRLSLAKRFKTFDGVVEWQPGTLFKTDDPNSGLDLVFSFAISY